MPSDIVSSPSQSDCSLEDKQETNMKVSAGRKMQSCYWANVSKYVQLELFQRQHFHFALTTYLLILGCLLVHNIFHKQWCKWCLVTHSASTAETHSKWKYLENRICNVMYNFFSPDKDHVTCLVWAIFMSINSNAKTERFTGSVT